MKHSLSGCMSLILLRGPRTGVAVAVDGHFSSLSRMVSACRTVISAAWVVEQRLIRGSLLQLLQQLFLELSFRNHAFLDDGALISLLAPRNPYLMLTNEISII